MWTGNRNDQTLFQRMPGTENRWKRIEKLGEELLLEPPPKGSWIEWVDGALRLKETKVFWLLVCVTFARAVWKDRCKTQCERQRAARRTSQILDEGHNLCRELATAAPNENRKRIAISTSTYFELVIEANRRKEIQIHLNRCRLLFSADESNEFASCPSGNAGISSDEERSINNGRNEVSAWAEGMSGLEIELERLGFC
ncbi:hypothetical protein R1flu_013138 [Riccia fluitans]|uniref:ATP synthase protein MI25 n=1 Tax=Riccia fluitans TaxID=41844 RepID=A0ABD1XEF7_9MARC